MNAERPRAVPDRQSRPTPSRAVRIIHERILPTSLGPMAGEVEILRIYVDRNDWWVGYYRGDEYHYVIVIPCVVIRFRRRA